MYTDVALIRPILNLVTNFHRSHQVEKKYLEMISPQGDKVGESKDFQELIAKMPAETSRLLTEFFKEGWTYKELASKYALTEVTLRKRMSRALGLLKKGINHE